MKRKVVKRVMMCDKCGDNYKGITYSSSSLCLSMSPS